MSLRRRERRPIFPGLLDSQIIPSAVIQSRGAYKSRALRPPTLIRALRLSLRGFLHGRDPADGDRRRRPADEERAHRSGRRGELPLRDIPGLVRAVQGGEDAVISRRVDAGAVDSSARGSKKWAGQITDLGRSMALFPLSPRLARMLVSGQQHWCFYIQGCSGIRKVSSDSDGKGKKSLHLPM